MAGFPEASGFTGSTRGRRFRDRSRSAIAAAPGPLSAALTREFPEIEEITRAFRIRTNRSATTALRRGSARRRSEFLQPDRPSIRGRVRRLALFASAGLGRHQPKRRDQIFGTDEAVGKRLTAHLPDARDFIVGAVFEDIPENSHLDFDVVVPVRKLFQREQTRTSGRYRTIGAAPISTLMPAFARATAPSAIEGPPARFRRPQSSAVAHRPAQVRAPRFLPVQLRQRPRRAFRRRRRSDSMKPPANRAAMVAISARRDPHSADRLRQFRQSLDGAIDASGARGRLAQSAGREPLPHFPPVRRRGRADHRNRRPHRPWRWSS